MVSRTATTWSWRAESPFRPMESMTAPVYPMYPARPASRIIRTGVAFCELVMAALPHRLAEGNRPDVRRISLLERGPDGERGDRALLFDYRLGRDRSDVGDPGRGFELPEEPGVGLDVHRAAVDREGHRHVDRHGGGGVGRGLGGGARRLGAGGRDGWGHRGRAHVNEPGVGRERLGDLVEQVRPDVA